MKKNTSSLLLLAVSFWLLSTPFADARVGGGRSSGSRGSRGSSSSSPYRSSQGSSGSSSPYRSAPTYPSAPQQPAGGGFMRSLGAGLLGGAIGSMLFGGMRGGFGGGGGGFGLLEILLLAGVAFMAFRFFKSRQQQQVSESGPQFTQTPFSIPPTYPQPVPPAYDTTASPVDALIAADPQFDLTKFNADRLDDFFRLQAAWANRDLAPLQPRLTEEMYGILNGHLQELKGRGQINKLDNIAVRGTELIDAWTEPGRLFATVLLTANLVDYTVTEATGEVVSGSKTEPVKFSEAWTFVRDTGFSSSNKQWRLSAIEQTDNANG